MKRVRLSMIAGLGGIALGTPFIGGVKADSAPTPWIAPYSIAQTHHNSDEFAWRLFVALNWPAAAGTRHADPSAAFGAPAPTVWESWKSMPEVYMPDGHDPGPWLTDDVGLLAQADRRFESISATEFPNARHVVDGHMVALLDPVAHAKQLTEAHMNGVAYNYIREHELYDVEGQIRAIQSAGGVQFPRGSVNVKAKWRPITDQEESRYHTTRVRLADGTMRLYGLSGLHVASKNLPRWLWATFEHVDNASLAESEGWLLPSRDTFTCRGVTSDCNRSPSDMGLQGTVWQFYRLRGTLTRFIDSAKQPLLLANSQLEAGDQRNSSCISCHARASLSTKGGRLTIFDGVSDDAQAMVDRKGSVGNPRPEWFKLDAEDPQARLSSLDFVWSLSKAQMRRGL